MARHKKTKSGKRFANRKFNVFSGLKKFVQNIGMKLNLF